MICAMAERTVPATCDELRARRFRRDLLICVVVAVGVGVLLPVMLAGGQGSGADIGTLVFVAVAIRNLPRARRLGSLGGHGVLAARILGTVLVTPIVALVGYAATMNVLFRNADFPF